VRTKIRPEANSTNWYIGEMELQLRDLPQEKPAEDGEVIVRFDGSEAAQREPGETMETPSGTQRCRHSGSAPTDDAENKEEKRDHSLISTAGRRLNAEGGGASHG
jgi:hypothetical protein